MEDLVGAEVFELGAADLLELGLDPELVGRRKPQSRRRVQKADRRYLLGLTAVTLGAAGGFTMTGTPSLKFRTDRIVLVDSVANNSTINSIKSGNVDQMLGGACPAAAFSPLAINTAMSGQTVAPNTAIAVGGVMAAAGTISGGIFGLADQ